MSDIQEMVVLVDEENNVLGTTPKSSVHSDKTPLHRAFSSFIFNSKGELLLQQRSGLKKTWPLIWSNSCCGHPAMDETNIEAAKRRLSFELGLEIDELFEVSPYRYQFVRFGVMENEICPIIVGFTDEEVKFNPEEVEAVEWIGWVTFLKEVKANPENWSEWCVEESLILEKNEMFLNLWKENVK